MRKIILVISLIFISFFFTDKLFAQTNQTVRLHFFSAQGCPHCAKEKIFLEKLKTRYPNLQTREYEITKNRNNLQLLTRVGDALYADVSGVPFTVVCKKYVSGYESSETTGAVIESFVKNSGECEDIVSDLLLESNQSQSRASQNQDIPENVKLPFFGLVRISDLSLPAFTLAVAFLDGFNPCAMWVLLFLISLLLGLKNRLRMFILGFTFILASGTVYFLFLSAWLNLFLFLGYIVWIRNIVGVVALVSGGYYLYDWYVNKSGLCKVTGGKKKRQVFDKLKKITSSGNFLLALAGIIALAFAVNLIELICSAGLPAVYTKVLTMSALPAWKYYGYLFFYILIFMLDDLIVFTGAMLTLHAFGLNTKYARYSHFFGGIIMLAIGLLMLFKPELLMFG